MLLNLKMLLRYIHCYQYINQFCLKNKHVYDFFYYRPVANYEDDEYHTTPIMSTYLLALIVADYVSIDHMVGGRVMYDVIARREAIDTQQGEYAFQVGQNLLARMSAHTDYDFYSMNPNLKMTQAAIPDFSAGAMENWGLLTYR